MNDSPNVKDIVLVGGGHTHALLIRMWAMNPTPGLRLTLISPNVHTPYSGMLPGFIAGHYSFDQIHIDLHKVCAWAGVRFIQAQATAIDTRAQAIKLSIRPAIEYDICSIDIGSTPNKKIPGSEAFAVPVKPISEFAQHWLALKQQLLHNNNAAPLKVAMIGGGAGGVEIITAMQYWSKQNTCNAEFCLISRGKSLLEGYPKPLQKKLLHHLQTNDIHYKLNFDTQAIDQSHIVSDTDRHAYDKVFYCTQASAANWLRSSDLALTENGFIQVNDQLQSLRHANIFAAGDISHQVKHPSPKAGVYAVRMAPTLFNNIIHLALNKPLQAFKPQKNFLSLLALGEKTALGSRRFFSFGGKWVWRLKDKIDSQFMNQFHKLPAINMGENEKSRNKHNETALLHPNLQKQLGIQDAHELNMRCGGCGGKIGASVITKVLKELSTYHQADILIGLNSSDDAAVLNIPNDKKLVQTIDHLKTLIDDPYLFGKLSALHALSDIFAMNAQPHSAQALVQLPLASEHIQRRDMSQLMQGALEVLNQHKCTLVGGHTSEDSQLHLGFCINALAN
ncbi:MAG: selenide,water dikinase, partial [Lentisphaeria bacterium]